MADRQRLSAPDPEVIATATDFGDLPDGYKTLLASDGASHLILNTGNPFLGARVDAETTGRPRRWPTATITNTHTVGAGTARR